jgi:dCTP deaminase
MEGLTELVSIENETPFILHPDEFVLAVTRERVEVPDDLVGRLDGKSSLGRLGLIVHSTAGFVDPGFKGRLTLELRNIANLPITLYYDMPVSQISFVRLTTPAEKPYGAEGSKYQGQEGPQSSRYYMNYRQMPPGKPHERRRGSK